MRVLKEFPREFSVGRGHWIDEITLDDGDGAMVVGQGVFWENIGIELNLRVSPMSKDVLRFASNHLMRLPAEGQVILLDPAFRSYGGIVLGSYHSKGSRCAVQINRPPMDQTDRVILPLLSFPR